MNKTFITSLILFITGFGGLWAGSLTVGPDKKASALSFDGNSTLHKYHVDVTDFDLAIEVDVHEKNSKKAIVAIKKIDLKIPVSAMESGKNLMNTKMYAALKSEKFPTIEFSSHHESDLVSVVADKPAKLSTQGQLTVAGVTQKITLESLIIPDGQTVEISGQVYLLMSKFGVSVPPMMFGALKTHDAITVNYKLVFDVSKFTGKNSI